MSKGSKPRPMQVSDAEYAANHERTFGKEGTPPRGVAVKANRPVGGQQFPRSAMRPEASEGKVAEDLTAPPTPRQPGPWINRDFDHA